MLGMLIPNIPQEFATCVGKAIACLLVVLYNVGGSGAKWENVDCSSTRKHLVWDMGGTS
jgi:hypothetical protein